MALGFVFMVFGMIGYVGGVLFSLMTYDIDDLRLATLISFLSVMSFMLGSILEVKDLSHSGELYSREQDKPAKVKKVYLTDLLRKAISYSLIIIAIAMIIWLICLLTIGI